MISSSERVSLPLAPTLRFVVVVADPFKPPTPFAVQPVPLANGVEVRPSPRVGVTSVGLGVLMAGAVALYEVVAADGFEFNDRPVLGTPEGVEPNNPPVGADEVAATEAGCELKRPVVVGAPGVLDNVTGVFPKSPPVVADVVDVVGALIP